MAIFHMWEVSRRSGAESTEEDRVSESSFARLDGPSTSLRAGSGGCPHVSVVELLFCEVYEGSGAFVVEADTALLGAAVGKRKVQVFGGRVDSAEFHGGAGQVLSIVVGLGAGDVLVHDQSPLFVVRDDVDAVGADGNLRVIQDEWNLGE